MKIGAIAEPLFIALPAVMVGTVILLPYITFVATLVLMRIAEVRHRARQARLAIESGHPAS